MAVIRDVMPVFELYQPGSIDDALSLLDRNGTDALVLAGGLDSMDWLKDRLKKPRVVVDLATIKELKGIKEVDGGLEIGAMTTLTEVVKHPVVKEKFSLLMRRRRSWRRRRRFATRAPSAATCRRTRAAGTTAAAGPAIAPAATSATPTRRRRSTASTRSSTPTAAWR